MKNTFGQSITLTLFGESHGQEIGAVLDGLAPGIPVNRDFIAEKLAKRRPRGSYSTARCEKDNFRIISGVYQDKTTGTPLCILIPNEDKRSCDYDRTAALARPAHADYTAEVKYHGYQDPRGGGHFSGRITAALVAAGAVLQSALAAHGIHIGTHIAAIGEAEDAAFSFNPALLKEQIDRLQSTPFPVLDAKAEGAMKALIDDAAMEGDSIGGRLESAVIGLPCGVGEPWFDTVEGVLSHLLFSVPAVKGVSFGSGFDLARMRGSRANDAYRTDGERVYTETNHQGGVAGGITNGMPLTVMCAVKPTPSIYQPQRTVSLDGKQNAEIEIKGRHDPCIVHRAAAVVDAVLALGIADLLCMRYGTDCLMPKGN